VQPESAFAISVQASAFSNRPQPPALSTELAERRRPANVYKPSLILKYLVASFLDSGILFPVSGDSQRVQSNLVRSSTALRRGRARACPGQGRTDNRQPPADSSENSRKSLILLCSPWHVFSSPGTASAAGHVVSKAHAGFVPRFRPFRIAPAPDTPHVAACLSSGREKEHAKAQRRQPPTAVVLTGHRRPLLILSHIVASFLVSTHISFRPGILH
jgi:hypothetical protein